MRWFNRAALIFAALTVVVAASAEPLGSGAATSVDAALSPTTHQAGDLDFSFDSRQSINNTLWAVAILPDGRVLIGGWFSAVNGVSRISGVARLNANGLLDTTFLNGLDGTNGAVHSLAVQPDGRVLIGGDFTTVNGVSRNRVARLNVDGSLDTTFLNGLDGASNSVYSLAVQPDGRVLLAGDFTTVNGVSRSRIARLNADGSLDTTFLNGLAGATSSPGDGCVVYSVALQPDGRVLTGGDFTTVNGVSRNRVARLNADGSLDTSFLNGFAGPDGNVWSLAVQPNGRVLIGGRFTTVNGVSRSRVARLNADGAVDTTFLNGLAGANNSVYSLAVRPDGHVLIGGRFTTVNGVSRNGVARLNANGSLDNTFLNGLDGVNGPVYSLVVQADGRVLIAGDVTAVNTTVRDRVARMNSDGSVDGTFAFYGLDTAYDGVGALVVQADGRMLIGGSFPSPTLLPWVHRNRVARLNADGTLDKTLLDELVGGSSDVISLAVQPDGRVLIAGDFTTVSGVSRNRIARLNVDGSLDTTFLNGLAGANKSVYSLAVQPDGRVLLAGDFTTVNGLSRGRVARLNADGSLDTTFLNGLAGATSSPGDGCDVYSLALQPDGRVLIAGRFAFVNGVRRGSIARLNADGSLDTAFLDGLNGTNPPVYALAVQPDGRVLMGGAFSTVNGVSRHSVARLNADGSLDTTFLSTGPDQNSVYSIAGQPDGRVLIGGDFYSINGVNRGGFVRLNADGSLDTTFLNGLAGVNGAVHSITVQPDGRVLIGGRFAFVNEVRRDSVARLHGSASVAPSITLQPSGHTSYDGCCAVFHVTATGTPLDYRWRKDGVDLDDGPGVSGTHTRTLTLTGVTAADEGDYSVVVNNFLGNETSNDAALTVASVPECKTAACDAELGCVLVDGCDDGDGCTTGDVCTGGGCVGTIVAAPSETYNVMVYRAGTDATLAWPLAAGATSSDVLRGRLASLPVGPGGGDEVCLGSTSSTTMTDSDVPAAGSGVWYLVRGANSCAGSGPYGFQGVHGLPGASRVSSTCP